LTALVVTTALPTLHQDLDVGVTDLSWTVNAYALRPSSIQHGGTRPATLTPGLADAS
jgi:hypothetical protein